MFEKSGLKRIQLPKNMSRPLKVQSNFGLKQASVCMMVFSTLLSWSNENKERQNDIKQADKIQLHTYTCIKTYFKLMCIYYLILLTRAVKILLRIKFGHLDFSRILIEHYLLNNRSSFVDEAATNFLGSNYFIKYFFG